LENSFYSVISPEGALRSSGAIRRKRKPPRGHEDHGERFERAGDVDEIVPEPEGGAHTDHEGAARFLDEVLDRNWKR